MANEISKITVGEGRLSFPHLFTPDSIDGGEPRFSCSIILPKDDPKAMAAVKQIQQQIASLEQGLQIRHNPENSPLKDGDTDPRYIDQPAYANAWILKASSKFKVDVLKAPKPLTRVTDENDIYGGCFGYLLVGLYSYNKGVKKGVSAALYGVLKTKDGEAFGGQGASALEAFDSLDIPTDMPDFEDVE